MQVGRWVATPRPSWPAPMQATWTSARRHGTKVRSESKRLFVEADTGIQSVYWLCLRIFAASQVPRPFAVEQRWEASRLRCSLGATRPNQVGRGGHITAGMHQ